MDNKIFTLAYKPTLDSNDNSRAIKTFLNDESGICYLIKNVLPDPGGSFAEIYLETVWDNEIVEMRGEILTLRRLIGSYANQGVIYRYSGKALTAPDWRPASLKIRKIVESITGRTFNFVVINLYHDGKDYIGWHNDKEESHKDGHLIASISLGATRDFMIKPYTELGKAIFQRYGYGERLTVPLEAGDLIVMAGEMQKNYKHTVPKRATVDPVHIEGIVETTVRLNLTFREMREYDS